MGITFLTQDNFTLQNGGQKMACDIDGICVVLFMSDKSAPCKKFWPIYTKISNKEQRVTFTSVDVGNNRKIIQMSKSTKTPIINVPYIVLYVDGRPYSIYKGKNEQEPFINFINDVVQRILQTDTSTPSSNTGVGREFINTNTPVSAINASFGNKLDDPMQNEVGRPTLPDGVTKIPHNKAWLADIKTYRK